ncbi:hypothetical protein K505DRAFT_326353 [Melanomma pulvis-pyrius CBS 109.77]|uniref:CENP-C homolog n=1 Tax=Melanomma pulvis-pyrius CBS 109.77 TaxID=1314802 RepID=A0A6A6X8D6_9PLEO|nr:hypothetical protein K505DRAFT_326353 [Melanomma pulvis-pyrius CBS 109.77]
MAPAVRKREGRENRGTQYFDVGVQGRKTGITLKDTGRRDEHGMEPISGIFSSPEKSPPKRSARKTGGTVTDSESMDLQESPIPDLTTSTHILRNTRTTLPPPRSRSPMKTALGSSPRRHTSVGPRAQSLLLSSPVRAISHAVSRRLDFEEDTVMQESPALSGSGQPRGKRSDIYDMEESPSRGLSAVLDESVVQEEINAYEESAMMNGIAEDSFVGGVGDDSIAGAELLDESVHVTEAEAEAEEEEEEVVENEPEVVVKQPLKRGRKRKSDALESTAEDQKSAHKPKKQAPAAQKGKKAALPSRRSNRISDIEEGASLAMDESMDALEQIEQTEQPPVAAKRRGRPPKVQPQPEKAASITEKRGPKLTEPKTLELQSFKKPELPGPKKAKAAAKPKSKTDAKTGETNTEPHEPATGRFVDTLGNPLSKADVDQMSTTSVGSRYGRGRQLLSVYRELGPDEVSRVGKTGRHRVPPVDFWKNEKVIYNSVNKTLESVVKNESQELAPTKRSKQKGRRRALTVVDEEDEDDLAEWEAHDGFIVGEFRDFDPETEVISTDLLEDTIGWAQKGINPADVPDASFRFTKLGSAGKSSFLSWGFIELKPDQIKRTKNSRRMHMVFHVTAGAVEVKVHDSDFTVHKGGVWQVPRGNTYSIRNVGSGTSRVFFSQAFEKTAEAEE